MTNPACARQCHQRNASEGGYRFIRADRAAHSRVSCLKLRRAQIRYGHRKKQARLTFSLSIHSLDPQYRTRLCHYREIARRVNPTIQNRIMQKFSEEKNEHSQRHCSYSA